MGNCKFPILDEKLEMVCDKGDIYHCQYLKSNHGKCRRKEIVLERNPPTPKKKEKEFRISQFQVMNVNIYPSQILTLKLVGVVDMILLQ